MNILHITDFHINNPSGELENLRDGFYEEFISNLHTAIKNAGIESIDFIVNTGDFINVGKTENFPHAKKVLDYAIEKFEISNNEVAVTIGNHDFKMKEPGTIEQKRQPFLDFSQGYTPGELVASTDIAKLYHNVQKKLQFLIIDNASRPDDVNQPIETTVAEQDQIVKIIRENNLENDLIIISHYPILLFPFAKYPSEDPDWQKNHVWQSGLNLQDRISTIKNLGRVIYFCGDGHIPDAFQQNNSHFIMTGMLGGEFSKRNTKEGKPYHLEIQARIYEISEDPDLWTFNYKPRGFDYDLTSGVWETVGKSKLRSFSGIAKNQTETKKTRTSVLSEPLEHEIIKRIKKEKLYKLDRFVTSPNYTSLSWVSINKLFEEGQLLINLIDKSLDWLSTIIKDKSKALLIGVDFHGTIIASHLSIRFGINHRCIANFPQVNHGTLSLLEIVSFISLNPELKDIVITTDVIASGYSVLALLTEIENAVLDKTGKNLEVNFHVISVISDQTIIREEFDNKISTIKTACGSLPMPILRSEQLPSIDILSPRIDFTN